jgi:hypothetical protein
MKDDIAMAGYLIVENTIDVYPSIDFNDKIVIYRLILPNDLHDNLKLLNKFKNGDSIGFWKSRRLKKFLEKKRATDDSGMGYDLEHIANSFLKGYLNNNWNAKVEIYKEENRDEIENSILHSEGNTQTD